jgi:membrane associated rhomboid family serine protease
MSQKPIETIAADNWMAGVAFLVISFALYIWNLEDADMHIPWLFHLCAFFLGLAVAWLSVGLAQKRRLRQDPQVPKKDTRDQAHN